LKTLQVTLLSLVALATTITAGCGSSGNPTFSKLPFASSRTADPATPAFLMKLDGSNVTPVPYTLGNFYAPSVSADLKRVAFVSFPNVWVMNSDGSGSTQLTTFTDSDADQFSYIFFAKISPDGKKILYSFWDGSVDVINVWIMNADGTHNQNLTATLPTGMTGCYSGSFSADSRKVTFACYGDSGDGLYIANADGTHQTTVLGAQQNAFLDTPSFSPGGKKILFVGFGFTVGGKVKPNAKFSPKPDFASARSGTRRHAAPGVPGSRGIFSVNLDGTAAALVVQDAYEAEVLNSTLYYTLYDSNLQLNQIWKSNADGTSSLKLSDGTVHDWLDLSSD
jgi:Tol biopolymer transport system component